MTDTDKELARIWAEDALKWARAPQGVAAARYILATLDLDERRLKQIKVLQDIIQRDQTPAGIEVARYRADVERLTKERDDALEQVAQLNMRQASWPHTALIEKPADEDAELDNVAQCLRETPHGLGVHEISSLSLKDYLDTMEQLVLLLAARVKELRRG